MGLRDASASKNHDLDKYNASDSLVKIEEGYNLTNQVWGEPQQTICQFHLYSRCTPSISSSYDNHHFCQHHL